MREDDNRGPLWDCDLVSWIADAVFILGAIVSCILIGKLWHIRFWVAFLVAIPMGIAIQWAFVLALSLLDRLLVKRDDQADSKKRDPP